MRGHQIKAMVTVTHAQREKRQVSLSHTHRGLGLAGAPRRRHYTRRCCCTFHKFPSTKQGSSSPWLGAGRVLPTRAALGRLAAAALRL